MTARRRLPLLFVLLLSVFFPTRSALAEPITLSTLRFQTGIGRYLIISIPESTIDLDLELNVTQNVNLGLGSVYGGTTGQTTSGSILTNISTTYGDVVFNFHYSLYVTQGLTHSPSYFIADTAASGTYSLNIAGTDRYVEFQGLSSDGLTRRMAVTLRGPVPEPSSVALMSLGLAGAGYSAYRRRRRRAA